MRIVILTSCLIAAATPALAQTVDAKGASALAQTLSKYLGKTATDKKVIDITTEGDSYRIVFSMAKLLESLPKQDYFKVDLDDLSLRTKPSADGSWNVSAASIPAGSVEMKSPAGTQSVRWSADNADINGIFDPKIGAFSKASWTWGSFKLNSTSPAQDIEASTGAVRSEMIGSAAAAGGVDLINVQSVADFNETITIKSLPPKDQATTDDAAPLALDKPVKVVFGSSELGANAEGKGLRNLELLDLWAFIVAHPDGQTLGVSEQAELKSKLLAALPLWDKIALSYNLADLGVETPLGLFAAKNVAQEINFDGVSKSGGYQYAVRTNGLKYPALPIPEWSVPFLPTDVELSFGIAGIDLDTVIKAGIADMDLKREKPFSDEFEANAVAAFVTNPPKVVINRSLVRTADTELTVEGEISFAGMKPQSRTTWEMAGFDAALDRLNNASVQEPEIKNYVVFAKLARDFGTQLPNGHIQWVVDQNADGSVNVNGNPVKGPGPVVGTGSDDALDDPALDDNVIVPDDEEDNNTETAPQQ